MALNVALENTDKLAIITLEGELDASTASLFQEKIKEAAQQEIEKLVLRMEELTYMASAGLRMLIFAKQQMGANVTIYIVAPQEMVKETIEKTGFHHSVILLDSYDLADISAL